MKKTFRLQGFLVIAILIFQGCSFKDSEVKKVDLNTTQTMVKENGIRDVVKFQEIGYWSLLEIKVLNGTAKEVAQKHVEMNAVKECLEAIPGCVYGGDLISTDNNQDVLVLCGWRTKADAQAWQNSPVREKQLKDAAGLSNFKVEMKERGFKSFYQLVQKSF